MALTKIDMIDMIHTDLGFQKKESSELLESLFTIMKDTLASGETIKISGFGSFIVKQKADRRGRNPANGEAITIAARKIVTYKVSSVLKERINESNP